ncbi:MAG: geranylgeranylglycerol-phosphate geranylgeranyltransferase [Bacteroidota bacterium]
MNLVGPFFRLIRWPNLAFIAITQCLFHFCVVKPSAYGGYYKFPLQLNTHLFVLLCLSSVLIAAGGYIINDYFDINIDLVNKPDKMVVDKIISRRWALLLHLIFSVTGILVGFYVSLRINNWLIGLANLGCVLLLWYYSTTYKRRLLIGNILISALTAWVVLVLIVAELPGWWSGHLVTAVERETVARLSRIGILYAAFAFVLTIIREAIKDMEDLEGDRKEGCRTMPIVWGINASKVFTAVWMVVIIVTITITQVYVIQFGWWWSATYIIIFVVVPLLHTFRKLYHAKQSAHFSYLSRLVKLVMLTGILSMVFFLWYTK